MPTSRPEHLIVADDHAEMATLLAEQLRDLGYTVETAAGGAAALELARRRLPDLVVTDLRMRDVDGLDVLAGIQALDPDVPVVIITAFGAVDSAIEAIQRGAFHYLTKPFPFDELRLFVERGLRERRLRREHLALQHRLAEQEAREVLLGDSAPIRAVRGLIERIAPSDVAVLVRGESGTGKELVARLVHRLSPRHDRPLIAFNCTALPETLIESELFGHVKGAFTGATQPRQGLFTEADRSTLFLDEIGDMPPQLQAKLLRVVEGGEIRAVGSDTTRTVNVRIVAATHQPLETRVAEGRFRQDLFYRLAVVPITVPPLRDRPEDLPLLVEHFLGRARVAYPATTLRRLSPEALDVLARYPWPGNVRELENLVKRLAHVVATEIVTPADVERLLIPAPAGAPPSPGGEERLATLRELEEEHIARVLRHCGGNKTRAAEILGIDVSTIHRRERGPRP
jgi:two-component system response regulator HydG